MKVAVIGGGVIGVTTAYWLAEDGHEVVLVERRDTAAAEASFGNAGLVTPSESYSWASPEALKMAVKSLYRSDLGIKYKIRLDPHLWLWSLKFLTQCTSAAARRNTLRKFRLISYSKDCLNEIVANTGIDYDALSAGVIYYFRAEAGVEAADQHMNILRNEGLELETIDRARMVELEPAMARVPEVKGGIYSPHCQTGDCYKFSTRLADWCAAEKSVSLRFSTEVERLRMDGERVAAAVTPAGEIEADAFVLAAGAESVFLSRPIGVDPPLYPVKGFSITAPLRTVEEGPRLGLVDEDRLVAMSRLGDRLRAASSAVFTGYDYGHRPQDFAPIERTLRDVFGDAADLAHAEHWTGLRPMTPSSVPIMGPSRYANLFLNVGHGHVGWSMSCGSGKFVADIIAGRAPAIDTEGLVAA